MWEAEQRAADELDRQLRARATIMVNDETLKQVRVAEEGAPASWVEAWRWERSEADHAVRALVSG